MRQVRDELGDEAVIVSTFEDADGHVRITAAIDKPDPDPAPSVAAETAAAGGAVADRVAGMLAYHGVMTGLSDRLVRRTGDAASDDPDLALAAALDVTFRFAPIADRESARPWMLVGPPGGGKTLTTAKLAARLVMRGLPATVVEADVSRAAAPDQLAAFTSILGVQLETATTPEQLAEILSGCGMSRAIFIDSFAVNPFDRTEMARLGAYVAAVDADPVLVLAAGLDAPEAAEIAEAFAELGAKRMITTRIDQTRRLGSLLTAAHAGNLVIADAGVTAHVAHGLAALNPVSLARLLCRDPDASRAPDTVQPDTAQPDTAQKEVIE